MNIHQRILLFSAGLYGAISVALAAVGAHAFHLILLANQQVETFAKAVDYAIYGALALLGTVALSKLFSSKLALISGYLFAIGTLLFSGSLFCYTLADMKVLTAFTPVGGTILIVAWFVLATVALERDRGISY